jgi:AraC-like DNA-binding protein
MQVPASMTIAATKATARIGDIVGDRRVRPLSESFGGIRDTVADGPHETSAVSSMTTRSRVFQTPLAAVDNLQSPGARDNARPEGFSPEFQLCFPYSGLFVWHVGQDDVVGDANQVLFVSGGESFRLSEWPGRGYGELVVTPDLALLCDLSRTTEGRLSSHPLFLRRSRRANSRLQNLRARFLHSTTNANRDPIAGEEILLDLLRCALDGDTRRLAPGTGTGRLIRRTKLFLEAHSCKPLRLGDVAGAVGASPAYLTDIFRRVEGVPLHKYLIQLRLSNALIELPHADDLTELALDLGFSSHSHFSAAFRRAFGCTPSAFRTSTRGARSRVER